MEFNFDEILKITYRPRTKNRLSLVLNHIHDLMEEFLELSRQQDEQTSKEELMELHFNMAIIARELNPFLETLSFYRPNDYRTLIRFITFIDKTYNAHLSPEFKKSFLEMACGDDLKEMIGGFSHIDYVNYVPRRQQKQPA